jgi:hypothetical protein
MYPQESIAMNLPLRQLLFLMLSLLIVVPVAAQPVGITSGFPAAVAIRDTAPSALLPSLPDGPAGAQGFVRAKNDGSFAFADGTPARFFGVTMQLTACFPDSADAVVIAARLRKLGVNLVRFQYMDFSYDWAQAASFLDAATGFRSLHEGQMRRFDWLFYQLKQHGIYSYLTLQSARAPRPEDGFANIIADSSMFLGRGMYQIYPQARAAHKRVTQLLLDHINSFTGVAYRNEPAIAALEIMDQGSITSLWRQNLTHYVAGQQSLSWHQSRRVDTLFAAFLQKKYSSEGALAAAWGETEPPGGHPNLVNEGSFEGNFEQAWNINSYDGTTLTRILTTDSVPNGKYALMLRIAGAQGNIYSGYMFQPVPLAFNTLYRISFRAKCSNPQGRTVRLLNATPEDNGLSGGLLADIPITPYWKEQEAYFIVPVRSSTPLLVAFYFGDSNGELTLDDIQIRRVTAAGLQAGESMAAASVVRIPWGNDANYVASSRRVQDQADFYMGLDRDYVTDMRRYIADTIRAAQPITGAASYWASGLMEAGLQGTMDFSTVQTGWDYISNEGGTWHIRNYSPLRATYAGSLYDVTTFAHARQPLIAAFQQPFPSRYQAESLLMLPLYAGFQGWDGVLWDSYLDNRDDISKNYIDSAKFASFAANPAVVGLLPAISSIVRNGLIEPGRVTLNLQHSAQQSKLVSRLEPFWGRYGLPGQMPGYAMAANRIVNDSMDAQYFTQRNDLGFDNGLDGSVRTDTRELYWEYGDGVLSVNAPNVQGASGYLSRSAGVSTDLLDINVQSLNETATVLWTPLNPQSSLGTSPGPSLLTIVTRTEPTGMHWKDTTTADRWGISPMLLDPVRVRLTFHSSAGFYFMYVTPLDATGKPVGEPIVSPGSASSYTVTIDQSTTKATWYSVQFEGIGTSAPESPAVVGPSITASPNVVSDRARVYVTLPESQRDARVDLLDMLGRTVMTLHEGALEQGQTVLHLDATGLSAGRYMVRCTGHGGEVLSAAVAVVR